MSEVQEVYRHSTQKVYLDIYGADADALPVATFTNASGATSPLIVVSDGPNVSAGLGGQYHVDLNMAQTQSEGDIAVTWDFTMSSVPVTKTDYLSVVSPILSVEAIREIHPNATDAEVDKVERAVRHIIQAHCGQTFGYYVGTKTVYGRGARTLYLPAHLLTLTSINDVVDPNRFEVVKDGWELYYYPWGINPYAMTDPFVTGGVIFDPTQTYWGIWDAGFQYVVAGEWGYRATPAAVAEAAKLLVNDYACGDSQYRDRFLTSMTAADWRIQFNDGAFQNTGNVRANQLLAEFIVKYEWVAI